MFIQGIPRKGQTYYAVYEGKRENGKVVRRTVLYIGRLDGLTEPRRNEIEMELAKLDDPKLIDKFRSIIILIGYKFPSPLTALTVEEVYDYGRPLAFHKVCEEIDLANTIDAFAQKGGGPSLGKVVEAMAISRNCDPFSYFQFPEWYARSGLSFFLSLPPSDLTYHATLNALDYLQPEKTVPMQVAIYDNIRKAYGYECTRLDIDITSTYFEGDECILAEYGYSRDHRPDRSQIVIAFVIDQKGVLVTHKVWPGNRTDAKSLKPVDRSLKDDFKLDAPRIMDRGFATKENLNYMDRKKERYLVALRAGVKSSGLLDEIEAPRDAWTKTGENEVATSIIKGKRKYVVLWNASVAKTNARDRNSRIAKAEKELNELREAVARGTIDSRKERDEMIGHILKKYRVKKYIDTKGARKGFDFGITRRNALQETEKYDGYQVFATTEIDLSEKDIVESYRTRDQIEKAIQTLKSVLGLHPQNVRTKEHVLGNIFICATAFQLRSILKMKLKEKGEDMSIDEALKALERLKVAKIVVGKGDNIQVHRKLAGLNDETRMLIEVFKMAEDEILPGVGTYS